MSTPSLQTFITDASQVLNLSSISAVRSVVAVALANANAGTPLNPNLTTQQLWNEFYQVVTEPKSNIESFIANQMMKFFFSPPAPGGVGADKQVIFNDMGVLAGDAGLVYNKTTDALTVAGLVTAGSATISGDLTVRTNKLFVNATGVGIGNTGPLSVLTVSSQVGARLSVRTTDATFGSIVGGTAFDSLNDAGNALVPFGCRGSTVTLGSSAGIGFQIDASGNATWQNVGGIAGTAMTLNSTGLGVGAVPNTLWAIGKVLQVGSTSGSFLYGASGQFISGVNAYYDTSWKYAANGFANYYQQSSGIHSWYTAPSGIAGNAITFTQAMTLNASGALLVGCTTAPNPGAATTTSGFSLNGNGNDAYISHKIDNAACGYFRRDGTDGVVLNFYKANNSAGTISVTPTTCTFNSVSDYRLKEAVKPLTNGITRVNALKPASYKWKVDDSYGEGFLAHELAEVVPLAVTGEKDAVNADGSIDAQGVDLSKVVPILVAAIQELTARVQTLEAR